MEQDFINGMYRSGGNVFKGAGEDVHVRDRAYFLRETAHCLRRHELDRELRKDIILDLAKAVLINKGINSACRIWSNDIIPVAMKLVALHIYSLHFLVRNLSSGWVFSTI